MNILLLAYTSKNYIKKFRMSIITNDVYVYRKNMNLPPTNK